MKKFVLFAALGTLAAGGAFADKLILRDGSQRSGRFVSGSGTGIVFQDDSGARRVYDLGQVQSVEFERLRSGRLNNGVNSGIRTDEPGAMNANANVTGSEVIPAGTDIIVRANETIDTQSANEGRTYPASVTQDIRDNAGNIIVPRGSEADLIVRSANEGGRTGSSDLVLDLQSLRVNGQRYLVSTEDVTRSNNQGLGKNRRTAEMVGGGAVLGTILGAIAGGGKGAAIGAIAGGAAGAGVQVLTRGKEVKVPAESTLRFRLDQPIRLVRQ